MARLWKRIKGRVIRTVSQFRNDCRFSLKLAIYRMIDDLCGRFGFKKVSEFCHYKKDEWIMTFLKNQLQTVVDLYKDDTYWGEPQENAPIWVCWWSGEETAPELVKQCIRSTRANAVTHPVHLITKNNYREYLEVPDYMLKKVSEGKMCFAHLADYIRVTLLAQRGGLWLDSTVFCADFLPDALFDQPFFTCRSAEQSSRYPSRMRWVTFVLGGWKGNLFYRYLKQAFEEYWKTQPTAIDYLMFDSLIELGYQEIPAIRKLIDAVPENNLRRDDLQAAMNRAASPEEWNDIVRPDTILYKLSWRETYQETTPDGQDSIYRYFLNREI